MLMPRMGLYRVGATAPGEDYSLQHVPAGRRHSHLLSLLGVTLAIPTALAFLAVGGALELVYGTPTLLLSLALASIAIGFAGVVLTQFASLSGLDSDLMSARVGFGQLGSAVTSLIYSANFVILFAVEDSIIVSAVQSRFPTVPRLVLLCAVGIFLLLTTFRGVAALTRLMRWTSPIFVILVGYLLIRASERHEHIHRFWSFNGSAGTSLSIAGTAAAVAPLMAFIVNATVSADVGRFLPPEHRKRGGWLLGIGLQVTSFFGAALLGAWLAFRLNLGADPGSYLVQLLGTYGVIYVLVSQIRINAVNAYAGSLSLSNFAARLFKIRPGRQVWLAFLIALGSALAQTNLYAHLLSVLTFEAVFVVAWVAALVAYILRHRLFLDASVEMLSLDTAPLVQIDGCVALLFSVVIAAPFAFGVYGRTGISAAPWIAAVVAALSIWLCSLVGSRRRGRGQCGPGESRVAGLKDSEHSQDG